MQALVVAVGAIFEAAFGRAPTDVRLLRAESTLTMLVAGTETRFERSLCEAGEFELIERERRVLRATMATALRAAVERSLGRAVANFSGAHDPETGTETLSFQLNGEPGLAPG